jgi:hypothetical protein
MYIDLHDCMCGHTPYGSTIPYVRGAPMTLLALPISFSVGDRRAAPGRRPGRPATCRDSRLGRRELPGRQSDGLRANSCILHTRACHDLAKLTGHRLAERPGERKGKVHGMGTDRRGQWRGQVHCFFLPFLSPAGVSSPESLLALPIGALCPLELH